MFKTREGGQGPFEKLFEKLQRYAPTMVFNVILKWKTMQCILCCISSSMRSRGGYAFLCVWLGSYTLRLTQWVTMTITSATELIFLISASQGGYLLQILVLEVFFYIFISTIFNRFLYFPVLSQYPA